MSSNLTGALALMVLDRRQSGSPDLTADKLKTITITVSNDDPLVSYQISRRVAQTHPDSVLAQLGVAYDTAFSLGSLPRDERPEAVRQARIAAEKALRMDPEFGDTYVPWCLLRPPTHLRECEDRMRQGLKADPDAPFVPVFLSSLLYSLGRFEEASQFCQDGPGRGPVPPAEAETSCEDPDPSRPKRRKRSGCSHRLPDGGRNTKRSTGTASMPTRSPAISTARSASSP